MSDEINPVALKLYNNIAAVADADTAYKIAFGYQLPLVATPTERQAWISYAMRTLERSFNHDEIRNIRQGCRCSRGLAKMHRILLGCLPDAANLRQLGEALEKATDGEWYHHEGALYRQRIYCSCPMVEDVNSLPSRSWCRCAEGYCKSLFGQALGCEVEAELLKSLKVGDDVCLVKVTPLGEPHFK